MVMVDEISFPSQITTSKPLSLLGHGITDIEIHFLQIKFTAIGVYLDPEIVGHLQQWKGKTGKELAENDDFFEALISAPVEKLLRVGVIKEIKGSQYGVQLESAVRDRLAADDKYEEEEEAALEKVVEFFQSKYFKKNSIITFHFPATSSTAEISFATEGKEDSKIQIENPNVVEMIKKWYLGGTRGVSSTTISCLANTLSAKLSTTHQPTNSTETMTTETVMVDEIPFPPRVATTKPLYLLGHGITDIEIHFLQIKFTAIGVYLDPAIVGYLQQWKGQTGKELAEDDDFFEAIIFAPVEKLLRIVVIKEIKGSQYGVQLESAVRDRLAADDKYEEEEEEALERVVEFFQSKYFKKNSVITFHFPATPGTAAEISFATDGKEDSKIQVQNANVVEMIKKWYLGGTRGVSSSTISCLANTLSIELSK